MYVYMHHIISCVRRETPGSSIPPTQKIQIPAKHTRLAKRTRTRNINIISDDRQIVRSQARHTIYTSMLHLIAHIKILKDKDNHPLAPKNAAKCWTEKKRKSCTQNAFAMPEQ